MQKVLEQARLLGQSIADSEVHQAMRGSEEAVMQDDRASSLMQEYTSLKVEVQQMLEGENPNEVLLQERSDRLQDLQDELNDMPIVQQMLEARGNFAQMMAQVNQVIQFMVTGEMSSDCGGDCGGCNGCGHTH